MPKINVAIADTHCANDKAKAGIMPMKITKLLRLLNPRFLTVCGVSQGRIYAYYALTGRRMRPSRR